MPKHILLKLAASALVMGAAGLGPAGGGSLFMATAAVSPKAGALAARHAEKAEAALMKRDSAAAISHAEQAVAAAPRDARYRALLGQAYMAAGRFTAARTSFEDTISLDPSQARAGFNLALSQIALGRWEEARAMLTGLAGKVREGDRGLAFALAGDPETAVAVLETAARAEGADARTRQNLALAYALAGDWEKSRATAAQDLNPRDVFVRMTEWARFAKPQSAWDQVASLLGVTPVEDAGQPVALALAPEAGVPAEALAATSREPVVEHGPIAPPVEVAQARPVSVRLAASPIRIALDAPAVPAATVAEAAQATQPPVVEAVPSSAAAAADADPEPPVMLVAPVTASPPVPAPAYIRPIAVAASALPPLHAKPKPQPQPKLAVAAAVRKPATRAAVNGQFVVQLGAYSTAERVSIAWDRAVGRHARLASYVPSSVQFAHAGGVVHRLAISGFATRAEAVSLCQALKAAGRQCFVRIGAGERPIQWVRRKSATQLASR